MIAGSMYKQNTMDRKMSKSVHFMTSIDRGLVVNFRAYRVVL